MVHFTQSRLALFIFLPLLIGLLWAPVYAGELYAVQDTGIPMTNTLIKIDTTTLAITDIGDVGVEVTNGGLAYDPNSDTLYMVDGRNGVGGQILYTVNRSTGVATPIGTHGLSDLAGLAFDSSTNTLYASTFSNPTPSSGELYTLNTTTGVATLIDPTLDFSGLAYDSTRDRLIGISGQAIHEINRATAAPEPPFANFMVGGAHRGLTYAPDLDQYWDSDDQGSLYSYDPFFGFQTAHLLNARPKLTSLAYVGPPVIEPISLNIKHAQIRFGTDAGGQDDIHVRGQFTLGSGGGSIDPLNEEIIATVGTATLVIPENSFIPIGSKLKFAGNVGTAAVQMEIDEKFGAFRFSLMAKGVDLTDTSDPVEIRLQIGNDAGDVTVRLKGVLIYNQN